MTAPERGLWIDDPRDREDLATFLDRALRLDDAAVVRLRERSGTHAAVAWVATGLEVLASRVVTGQVRPSDLSAGADALVTGLSSAADGYVDPGFPMDSAWRGGLPPEDGFVHLDDVPARVMLDLAQQGGALAREHGSAHGPPASLMDQEVIAVSSGDEAVGVPMRCVFALTAMGFLPQTGNEVSEEEIVRVRAHPSWLRIDARFGSVYRRRESAALILG
ncbi:hypothetical protein B7435_28060 [Mycolicibacterium peregrinum]|uniref:hypothetical protein n=1 Tax=Mycolicibacterium peregrinum TaxID=43304 RepID=UPI0006D82A2E|nr:hypothetical protein [Mycolicibacterium peregrinum]MCV7202755.1 hypothetical protein [Mycolicibacterium peregrinum]ORW58718.1 hypothetical protein AWC21_15245 [Mycolicibacterium peregrinum]OWL96297.1 hypothetical protein B7435_28060 [Mycolicibacterium peregrinum]